MGCSKARLVQLAHPKEAVDTPRGLHLDELPQLGVSPEAVVAVSLVPLVLVAWAEGKDDEKERLSVHAEAIETGIEKNGAARLLLDDRLKIKPNPQLAVTWRHYINAVTEKIGPETQAKRRQEFLRRARLVAAVTVSALVEDQCVRGI